MAPARRCLLLVPALAVALASARADEEAFPAFTSGVQRDSREFVTKVGAVIVKAARSRPQRVELKDFAYTKPRANRSELTLKMSYTGAVTKSKFTADIVLLLDTEDNKKWEVLKITYKDSNRSPIGHSEKKVQGLVEKFNK